jgi:hypothetical protein
MLAPDELSLFTRRLEQVGAPYMITGATAAIIYGQPRMTNDLDLVLALEDRTVPALLMAFPEAEFYVPPESVIRTEQARHQRGHFNIIHHESGYKADVYLAGADPLHRWALPLRRRVRWGESHEVSVAPPEYVILRKLEFFREGGSSKHPQDIQSIRRHTTVDEAAMQPWLERMQLVELWHDLGD